MAERNGETHRRHEQPRQLDRRAKLDRGAQIALTLREHDSSAEPRTELDASRKGELEHEPGEQISAAAAAGERSHDGSQGSPLPRRTNLDFDTDFVPLPCPETLLSAPDPHRRSSRERGARREQQDREKRGRVALLTRQFAVASLRAGSWVHG